MATLAIEAEKTEWEQKRERKNTPSR